MKLLEGAEANDISPRRGHYKKENTFRKPVGCSVYLMLKLSIVAFVRLPKGIFYIQTD